jgi:hypothetical protein
MFAAFGKMIAIKIIALLKAAGHIFSSERLADT